MLPNWDFKMVTYSPLSLHVSLDDSRRRPPAVNALSPSSMGVISGDVRPFFPQGSIHSDAEPFASSSEPRSVSPMPDSISSPLGSPSARAAGRASAMRTLYSATPIGPLTFRRAYSTTTRLRSRHRIKPMLGPSPG